VPDFTLSRLVNGATGTGRACERSIHYYSGTVSGSSPTVQDPFIIARGGNRTGRVGFGFEFGSDGSNQFDLPKEIESGLVRSRSD
jgi:hypothetical protein